MARSPTNNNHDLPTLSEYCNLSASLRDASQSHAAAPTGRTPPEHQVKMPPPGKAWPPPGRNILPGQPKPQPLRGSTQLLTPRRGPLGMLCDADYSTGAGRNCLITCQADQG
eukprot:11942186-Alexandrium_andersonii.AAC.1